MTISVLFGTTVVFVTLAGADVFEIDYVVFVEFGASCLTPTYLRS